MLKTLAFALLLALSGADGQKQKPAVPAVPLAQPGSSPEHAKETAAGSPLVENSTPAKSPAATDTRTADITVTVKCAIPVKPNEPLSASTALNAAANCRNSAEQNSEHNPTLGLNDRLFLVLSVRGGNAKTADALLPKLEDWRLSINSLSIDDASLFPEAADDSTVVLSTKLKRTDASKSAWNELFTQKLRDHTVSVTAIDASKKPLASEAYFNLQAIQMKWYSWILLGILLILVIILLTHRRLREMLRDDGPWKTDPANPNTKAAYSLSRVQMFYWFSITLVCYVVIWIVTGDRDTVNNDVLALIGISAGTFLGAVAIDSSKKAEAQSDLPEATAKLEQSQAAAAALTASAGAAAPAAMAASAVVATQVQGINQLHDRTLADCSENFLTDILSDEDGLSFHRFQIFAWSLILGVIFIASVIQTLNMPTFGNTLLGLMGISGGTYLGFKFPEQKTK